MVLRHTVTTLASVTLAWSALASDPSATITALSAAPTHISPSGSATVHILAQGDNAFIGKLVLEAGATVPLHRDATEEYIHVLSGGGDMTIDGVRSKVQAGDTVFMPAGAEVSFTNGPAASEVLQVFSGPGPADKYATWPRR